VPASVGLVVQQGEVSSAGQNHVGPSRKSKAKKCVTEADLEALDEEQNQMAASSSSSQRRVSLTKKTRTRSQDKALGNTEAKPTAPIAVSVPARQKQPGPIKKSKTTREQDDRRSCQSADATPARTEEPMQAMPSAPLPIAANLKRPGPIKKSKTDQLAKTTHEQDDRRAGPSADATLARTEEPMQAMPSAQLPIAANQKRPGPIKKSKTDQLAKTTHEQDDRRAGRSVEVIPSSAGPASIPAAASQTRPGPIKKSKADQHSKQDDRRAGRSAEAIPASTETLMQVQLSAPLATPSAPLPVAASQKRGPIKKSKTTHAELSDAKSLTREEARC